MHALPPRRRSFLRSAAPVVVAACAALFGIGVAAGAGATTASLKPSDPWNTFSTDITIRRSHTGEDGKALSTAPAVTYHWEQRLVSSGWKSTMTLTAHERPTVQSLLAGPRQLDGTFSIARIEDAGDGSPVRVFDKAGQPVQLSAAVKQQLQGLVGSTASVQNVGNANAVRTALRGKEWIDPIVADPAKAAARRSRMVTRYGQIVGQVNGRDRILRYTSDGVIEVLLERPSAVPVEINVSRNGALAEHTTIAYVSGVANMRVRRTLRAERVLPNSRGARVVTTTELANVRLENRSGQ